MVTSVRLLLHCSRQPCWFPCTASHVIISEPAVFVLLLHGPVLHLTIGYSTTMVLLLDCTTILHHSQPSNDLFPAVLQLAAKKGQLGDSSFQRLNLALLAASAFNTVFFISNGATAGTVQCVQHLYSAVISSVCWSVTPMLANVGKCCLLAGLYLT